MTPRPSAPPRSSRTRSTWPAVAALVVAAVLALASCGDDEGALVDDAGAGTSAGTSATVAGCDLGPVPEEPDPEVAASPVEFEVQGDLAVMTGTIGADFVHRTCDLVEDDPQVGTVELLDVPGSSTEGDQTLEAGLVLREAGLGTVVPGDGQIESGGVDFFLAGSTREVADGACLGVHATEIDLGDGPISAADLPPDDPEHEPYVEYFRSIGIPEDFYWFTLSAAPPAGIHYLTPDEMVRFAVVTGDPPSEPCPLEDSTG